MEILSTDSSVVYKDFDSKSDKILLTNDKAIRSAVLNLLTIRRSTVFGKPEIGSLLEQFLFEPMDFATISRIQETVENVLYSFENRITNIQVEVVPERETNAIFIQVSYDIKDNGVNNTIVLKLR